MFKNPRSTKDLLVTVGVEYTFIRLMCLLVSDYSSKIIHHFSSLFGQYICSAMVQVFEELFYFI